MSLDPNDLMFIQVNINKFVIYLRDKGLINYSSCCNFIVFGEDIQIYCKTCPSPRNNINGLLQQITVDDFKTWLENDRVEIEFQNILSSNQSIYRVFKKIITDCNLSENADNYIKGAIRSVLN